MILILAFNLVACSGAREEKKRYQAQFLKLFNTVTQVVGYAYSEEEFNEQCKRIYEGLKEYHHYTIFTMITRG
jgi:thiamine biosynthesis lipoprotein